MPNIKCANGHIWWFNQIFHCTQMIRNWIAIVIVCVDHRASGNFENLIEAYNNDERWIVDSHAVKSTIFYDSFCPFDSFCVHTKQWDMAKPNHYTQPDLSQSKYIFVKFKRVSSMCTQFLVNIFQSIVDAIQRWKFRKSLNQKSKIKWNDCTFVSHVGMYK